MSLRTSLVAHSSQESSLYSSEAGPLLGFVDITPASEAIRYFVAARSAGKDVQIHLYDEASHNFIDSSATRDDAFRRSVEFLNRHLRR